MKKIPKIILSEVVGPSVIALLVLTFVVFTREFGRLAELLIRKNADSLTVFRVVLSLLPGILVFTIPFAFLVGTLIGIGRLSADSEIVAMRASGLSIHQMLWPVLKVGVGVTLVTLFLTCVLLPQGNWSLRQIRHEIGLRPVQSQIKPRVFHEDFPGMILYVEDIDLQTAAWRGVFLAEQGAGERRIILSNLAYPVFPQDAQRVQLHFEEGMIYTFNPHAPDKDSVTRFQTLDVPVAFPAVSIPAEPKQPEDRGMPELFREARAADESRRLASIIELQRRVALPLSALVFAVLGVTLGIHAPRGGRGYGFVVSVIIAFTYYILFVTGIQLAEMGQLPVVVGVWGANLLLGLVGLASIYCAELHGSPLQRFSDNRLVMSIQRGAASFRGVLRRSFSFPSKFRRRSQFRSLRLQLARVIDLYIMRNFSLYFALALVTCVALFYLFTFFELVDDIFANDVALSLLFDYFFYLLPHILMLLIPVSVLIGTLVAFGLLDKTNQIVALKACGVSVYRVAVPLFALVLAISAFEFVIQEYVLPYANQKQDSLRNVIKGRPVQTHYQMGYNWIFGESNQLYNYSYFDSDHWTFAELAIYELNISRSQLVEHTYARQAVWDPLVERWVLQDGWKRSFQGSEMQFSAFDQIFSPFREAPGYFEKEVKDSGKMTYLELEDYIEELQQGGFEVDHLRTELYKKISFPFVSFLMSVLGIPFAFTLGRKGALYGIGVGVIIGICYWGTFGIFGLLGANGMLSPVLAAWGPNLVFGAGGALLLAEVRS